MLYDAAMIERMARDQRQREQQFAGVLAETAADQQADQVMAPDDQNNAADGNGNVEETKMITTTVNCNGVVNGATGFD